MTIHPVFQRRIFFFIVLLLAGTPRHASSRQEQAIKIEASSGARVETVPGRLITLSFKVTNASSSIKRFESSLVPPSGWRRLSRDFPFEIAAGASDVRLVSVSIPAEAKAGEYPLRFTVRNAANKADASEITMNVVIATVSEHELRLLDSPRLAVGGETYASTFLITNKGNVANRVRLKAISSNGFAALPDSTLVNLQPGEARTITVTVKSDVSLKSKAQDIIELSAEIEGREPVRVYSYVDVVPRVTGTEDQYVRFPLTARARFAGESGRNGAQIELMGSGSPGISESDRLDLLIRTPDIQQKSILGRRDEYQIGYTTQQYELFVGDKNYSLSPLTEYNRYGFGVSGDVKLSSVTAGVFYNESRFFSPRQKEYAAYATSYVTSDAQVGINYLRKQEKDQSDIVTARSILHLVQDNEIDLEYGYGTRGGVHDRAYAARWTGRGTWYSFDGRYVQSGSSFPGYFSDVALKNLSLALAPVGDLRFEAYYRDEERNLGRDTSLMAAPRDRYFQLGAGYGNALAVYFRSNDQDDLLPIARFKRRDDTWQVRAGFNVSRFMLIGSADFGTIRDKLAETDNPYRRYSLFSSLQPFDGHTYGFTIEYSTDRDATTLTDQHRVSAGFTANIYIGEATQFAMSIFGNRTRGDVPQTYTLADVSLEHDFPFGHSILLRGRQSIFTPSIERKEIAYLVEYTVPIGVPIARSTVSGQLTGRVVDSEKGIPVPNVLLYAGSATAVTDRDGQFSFPSLKPDRYVLQLDMSTVGLSRVSQQRLPQELTIVGGEETRFDISLTRSVSVVGTVLLYPAQEQSAADTSAPILKDPVGHTGAVVELSNADEVHRRLTDSRGRYAFADIRPGTWTLKIIIGNLPENYTFEKDAFELTLVPGSSTEITFKALPRKRRVQILRQGQLIVAPPQTTKPQPAPVKEVPVRAEKPGVAEPSRQKADTIRTVAPSLVARPTIIPEQTVQKPADRSQQKADTVRPIAPSPVAKQTSGPESSVDKPIVRPAPRHPLPSEVSVDVVFVPRWLRFSIEFASWPGRSIADSAALHATARTGLPSRIEYLGLQNGRPSYRVLIGLFSTRRAAETQADRVRGLLQ